MGPDKNIWFAERRVDRIGKITPDGTITEYQLPFGSAPTGVTSGPLGKLWVTLAFTGQIAAVSRSGEYRLFNMPRVRGRVAYPWGIVSGGGDLWIADNQGAIDEMTPSGHFSQYATTNNFPVHIVAGKPGYYFFTAPPCCIGEINASNGVMRIHYYPGPIHGGDIGDLTFDADHNIWLTDWSNERIDVYISHPLSVSPSTIILSGPGQEQTIQVSESAFSKQWSATSSDPGVCSVVGGSTRGSFTVTSVGVGTATVAVSDTRQNTFDVSVTVQ